MPPTRTRGQFTRPATEDGLPINQQAPSFEPVDTSADRVFDPPVALYVGGAGDVRADAANAAAGLGPGQPTAVTEFENVLLASIPSGSFVPVLVRRIYNAGTTATNIVALHAAKKSAIQP